MRDISPLLLAILVLAGADPGQAGFCGNYRQVSSNAGACPTCTLLIADNPEIQKYFVEASNGWSAELTWIEGDDSVAEGSGQFPKAFGGAYGGKRFSIEMTQQGQRLDMVIRPTGGPGPIEARFRCTD